MELMALVSPQHGSIPGGCSEWRGLVAGTLTRNEMEFFKCSIAGVSYGTGVTEIERAAARRVGAAVPVAGDAAAAQQWRAPSFNFYDKRLLGGAWRNEARPDIIREFFRVLAVCHTVIPDGVLPRFCRFSSSFVLPDPLLSSQLLFDLGC